MGNKNTSTRVQLNLAHRTTEWLQLYASGHTYQQIADLYQIRKATVIEAVHNALVGASSRRAEAADHLLELHLERLERLLRAHWPIALNTREPEAAEKAARVVLGVLDREARLWGLDQPQRVDVTVRARDEIDEEIARLVTKLKTAAGPGVDTPVLDGIVAEVEALPAGSSDE